MTTARPTQHRGREGAHRALVPPAARSSRTRLIAGGLSAAMAGGALVTFATTATAATMLPVFPDNVVVFPNRDMVVLEGGFGQDQPVLVEVHRDGRLMGAVAGATVTGGEWEVNHPGGPCWGDGTTLGRTDLPQVTPDIRPGDVVSVRNAAGQLLADTVVQDGYVTPDTAPVMNTAGTGFTVTGHAAAAIPDDQMEQRIINPELTGTGVARRDIRAVLTANNAMEPAPKGGYSSRLEVDNAAATFTAFYDFTMNGVIDVATARSVAALAASSGGERLMSWELTDAAANRQGLTIAEDDEFNGPGMGGCPSGPADAAPTAGQFGAVWNAAGTGVQVSWSPATTQPGAPAVTGYSVEAVATVADANGDFPVHGKRTAADRTRTTIEGLTGGAAGYTVEVRPLIGTEVGAPFPAASGAPTPPPDGGPADTTAPTVTATQGADGSVTLMADEPNVDMYYTTDGSGPLDETANLPAQSATLYTGPIPVPAPTTVRWVGFDLAGNVSAVGSGSFQPAPAPAVTAPDAPGVLRATSGDRSVSLTWQAGADGGSPLTGYTVTTFDSAGTTAVGPAQPVTETSATVRGLTNGTEYTFRVVAHNAGGTTGATLTSAPAQIKARPGDTVTVDDVRYRENKELRILGSGSDPASTYTVYHGAVGDTSRPLGSPVVAPAAVGTGVTWELRLRDGQATLPTSGGNVIWVQSSGGGVASLTFR